MGRHWVWVVALIVSCVPVPNAWANSRGCCSLHGGIAACSRGANRLVCNDGTFSPSCSCEDFGSSISKSSERAAPEIGKDILVKDKTVHVENLRPEMNDGLNSIVDIWKSEGLAAPVITSGNDGIHPDKRKEGLDCSTEAKCRETSGSRHYQDLAVDVRSNDLPDKEKQKTLDNLKAALQDNGYYVKLEYPGQAKEHFHIQYNPSTSKIPTGHSKK